LVKAGTLVEKPFLDISERISSGGERGLLGLAFDPEYPTDPRFFVNYTDRDGNTVVSSFTVSATDPDVADPASEKPLMHIAQPFANHNGGAVVFGPDRMLYIATGDGGSGGDPQGNGQRLDTHLGKILRIDVNPEAGSTIPYRIPNDNPFFNQAEAEPEIWLYGLRNPWRIRFDRDTGDLWIGDVGQNAWEEIDVVRAGQRGLNFGWNTMEATHCYEPPTGCDRSGLVLPVAEYGHDQGCSVTGGTVYRGSALPGLVGQYVFSDYCSGRMWIVPASGDEFREQVLALESGRSISAIAAGPDDELYVTDLRDGVVLRVVPPGG
jgi:glucose/arabinose dehydrogenase